eukprot:8435878-Pyramimonas_sp.AAC.2
MTSPGQVAPVFVSCSRALPSALRARLCSAFPFALLCIPLRPPRSPLCPRVPGQLDRLSLPPFGIASLLAGNQRAMCSLPIGVSWKIGLAMPMGCSSTSVMVIRRASTLSLR